MRRVAALVIISALISVAGFAIADNGRARNVVVLISDGCGYKHIEATNLYLCGRTGVQVYEQFPIALGMSTYMLNGSYDPGRAWTDFSYVESNCTDSAAAATAMSTGVKTSSGAIGVGPDTRRLGHALEQAEELGRATGVVTSVQFSHATPAGFVAHNVSRGNYSEIAIEMIQASEADVIMGCGHPFYDDDGNPRAYGPEYKYVGGVNTWNALADGTAGSNVDADHNGILDDAWTLIQTREDFLALTTGPTPKRIVGVPQVHKTLQYNRSGVDGSVKDDLPYQTPLTATVPTLAEMTQAALNVLDNDPDGFFLVVEGGAVDWAAHASAIGRMIEEQIDFNNSVQVVVDWVEANSNWTDTLVIVTADHETGYLTRPSAGAYDIPWSHEPLDNNGAGNLPGVQWNSGGHTNSLVPFYARGAGAGLFRGCVTGTDPHIGQYIDNTAIFPVVSAAMKGPALIIESADDRGEGPVHVVPPGYSRCTMTVDVCGRALAALRSVRTRLRFLHPQSGEVQLLLQGVDYNEGAFPGRIDLVLPEQQTAGFSLPAGDGVVIDKTWLYTLTYTYAGYLIGGENTIDTDPQWTSVTDSAGDEILVDTFAASLTVDQAWPAAGDATMDCKVNILDLVFVRNCLGVDPSHGDCEKADVNGDGRLNILDLLYVRSHLGTRCKCE